MEIKILKVGYLQTNCYILGNNDCLIIDPGDEIEKIKEQLKDKNLLAILLTHNHFDHVGCVNDLIKLYNCKLYKKDNLKEQNYNIKEFNFDVIFTPGHTSDSVTYYFKKEKIMFVGDFIFKESIGRTDLDTGSIKDMKKSLNKIKKYNNITIYPGHGDITDIDYEKKYNCFLEGE